MPKSIWATILVLGVHLPRPGGTEELVRARHLMPEASLLDVGLRVFDPGLPEDPQALREVEQSGIFPDVRRAEARYVPVHLARTLVAAGFWGVVRIVPKARVVDLELSGTVLASNGAELRVLVRVVDAGGNVWLDKEYKEKAEDSVRLKNEPGDERFQGLYNEIANDIYHKRKKLDEEDVQRIRTVQRLRFAANLAPAVFEGYLAVDKRSRHNVVRLPSRDDPMMARVELILARDGTFLDMLHAHYGGLYEEMRESYSAWRSQDYWERETIKNARDSSSAPMGLAGFGGPRLGPVCITPSDFEPLPDDSDRRTKKDRETHIAALRELGDSLASDVAPLLVEVEGEVLRLTGSVEAQYATWRQLLQEIFATETGLPIVTREARFER